MALLHELAAYATAEVGRPARAEVVHHAKRAVLDWLAALYPGTRVPPATLLVEAAREELGRGRSSVVGFGTTAFPATAAWINGTASHAVEYDDIFRDAVYHPGSPTIAAALALAEARGASGRELLAAIVVGYEISTRVGAAVQPSHVRYFHATGTVGCLGAAASAAALLAPRDETVVRHALATATTFASGIEQALRSDAMTKALHSGHAAAVGVRAAQAAARGVTGAADILEGRAGFGAAMADGPRWERATEGLGEVYNITRISHKVHSCCGHMFAAIDAALALRAAHALVPSDVAAVHVSTYRTAIEAGKPDARTPYEARFSIPYVVSHALVHGSVRLDAFTPERLESAALRSLMPRCTVEADSEMSAGFPSRRSARVTITTTDGRVLTHLAPHRRGDPEAPLTDAELGDKFEELCAPVLGRKRALALRDQVWRLEALDVNELKLAAPRP